PSITKSSFTLGFVIRWCQDVGTSPRFDVAILTILSVLAVLGRPDIARQFTLQTPLLQSFTAIHALTAAGIDGSPAGLVPRLRYGQRVRHSAGYQGDPMSLPALSQSQRIVASLPFVEALARRMAASMPHSIDIGDLVQDGVIGLIDAANRFDEGRGIKFETFAERRVRGAMIDALRRATWPRSVRPGRRGVEVSRQELPRAPGCV